MSAKNSFDLVRKPVKQAPRKRPAPRATSRPRKSLKERRRAARNLAGGLILLIIAVALGAVIYGFWRPEVRISEIRVSDVPDLAHAEALVTEVLDGAYLGVFPRDSVFFYPEQEARAALLDAFPSLSAVSVSRASFTALEIRGTERVSAFYWCGTTSADFTISLASCYEADADGLVFASAPSSEGASTTERLRIYAPIDTASSTTYPLRARVIGYEHLPSLLRFIGAVRTLGIPVLSSAIQGDEAELFVTPETRIKYVLGREEEAAKSAEAAFPTINFLDGSVEYADLRFDGKVYVKRRE
jgi:hypothetical protein